MRKKDRKILLLYNEVEARLVESVLKERGIPHFIKAYRDHAYDSLWQSQYGWGHIEAPVAARAEIEAIYRDITGREPQEPG